MLNTDILETLFETQTRYHDALWGAEAGEDEQDMETLELKPLYPVVTITSDDDTPCQRPIEIVYPVKEKDDKGKEVTRYIRLRFGHHGFNYSQATYFEPNKELLAQINDPSRPPEKDITIDFFDERNPKGSEKEASIDSVLELKGALERQSKIAQAEYRERQTAYFARKAALH